MGKNARRILVLGFSMAVLTMPAFSLSVSADEILAGHCGTALHDTRGPGVAPGPDAALTVPNNVGDGGDPATTTNGRQAVPPALNTDKALGLNKLPVVDRLCAALQGAVDAVGHTTKGLLSGQTTSQQPNPGEPEHTSGNPDPRPMDPTHPVPAAPAPEQPAGPAPSGSGTGVGIDGGKAISGIFSGGAFLPGNIAAPVIAPSVPPGQAPALSQHDDLAPVVLAERAATAQALPVSNPPARLPLLVAVLTLSIVGAALVRTWIRRRTA